MSSVHAHSHTNIHTHKHENSNTRNQIENPVENEIRRERHVFAAIVPRKYELRIKTYYCNAMKMYIYGFSNLLIKLVNF